MLATPSSVLASNNSSRHDGNSSILRPRTWVVIQWYCEISRQQFQFLGKRSIHLQSVAATYSEGFVICFLKVPLAGLSRMTAAVQPNTLGNSQKTFNKTFGTSCRPTLYGVRFHITFLKLTTSLNSIPGSPSWVVTTPTTTTKTPCSLVMSVNDVCPFRVVRGWWWFCAPSKFPRQTGS